MASAFVTAFLSNSEDLEKFRDPEICGMCGGGLIKCHCYDTHDYDSYEKPEVVEEESGYCSGCKLDERYCECWKDEWDFNPDMDDFDPLPEADDLPMYFFRRWRQNTPRIWDYDRDCGREREPTWKRQVRAVKQWARHTHRIAKNVKPLDFEAFDLIRWMNQELREQQRIDFVANNIVRRERCWIV